MTRKIKKQQLVAKIVNRLKELYGISDKELESGALIYQSAIVLPEEIALDFFRSFGVEPAKFEFGSWSEFIDHLAEKILPQRRKS